MTNELPWPSSFLAPASWTGVSTLVTRCHKLASLDALPQTLMLVGAPGLGREALAVELAAALICRTGSPPGCHCPVCERVRRNIHPDVEIITPPPEKAAISIDQTRQLTNGIAQAPFESTRRIYIIAGAENPPLGEHAASALLKTLEEPPSHALLILLAANPGRCLPTIVSRSVQLRIPAPTRDELLDVLREALGGDAARAGELLDAFGGDAWLALSLLDEEQAERLKGIDAALAAALAGDGLALLAASAAMRDLPRGITHATTTLLRHLAGAPPERAELVLDAAAALLDAEVRRAALNLDVEGAAAGALATVIGTST